MSTCKNVYHIIIINLRFKLLLLLKIICFIILCYECLEITVDFLHYPYVYKFSVETSKGLDIPPITICTERDVFFDKTRFEKHFNLSDDYESYKSREKPNEYDLYNQCFTHFMDAH